MTTSLTTSHDNGDDDDDDDDDANDYNRFRTDKNQSVTKLDTGEIFITWSFVHA